MREHEMQILADARAWGLGIGSTTYVDDFRLLADLQHYGVNTRLIDFSYNPLTALWFACQKPGGDIDEKSGLVLALNVTKFPAYTTVRTPETWDDAGYGPSANLEHALASGGPFLLEVSHPNERLRAQEGLFVSSATPDRAGLRWAFNPFRTINIPFEGTDARRLAASLRGDRSRGRPAHLPFVAVLIPAGLKKTLLQYLSVSFNRTARTLFPDFAGFREHSAVVAAFEARGTKGERT